MQDSHKNNSISIDSEASAMDAKYQAKACKVRQSPQGFGVDGCWNAARVYRA